MLSEVVASAGGASTAAAAAEMALFCNAVQPEHENPAQEVADDNSKTSLHNARPYRCDFR